MTERGLVSARMYSNAAAPRNEEDAYTPPAPPPDSPPQRPIHFSKLKKAYRERKIPEIKEGELEERFVRGSGPGGQSINKTENCVQLLHRPTGIRVSCQETRSLAQNRRLARKMLVEKLDKMVNPGLSKGEFEKAKKRERERRRKRKARKREEEREGGDDVE